MYYHGNHVGALGSTYGNHEDSDKRVYFNDIADESGDLKPGKIFDVYDVETDITTKGAKSEFLNIGGGTFNDAGGVGMWFRYAFEVKFYKRQTGDLEAVEIKSPKKVDALKDTGAVVAVRNNSESSYEGKYAPVLRLEDGFGVYEMKTDLAPGEEKDVRIPWKAPDTGGTIEVSVTINPDKAVEETDYDNNSAVRNVIIAPAPGQTATPSPSATPRPPATPRPAASPPPPPSPVAALPDFSVTGFREASYTEASVVKSYVKVRYSGTTEQRGVQVDFNDGVSTQRNAVNFSPNEEKEVEFSWFTPQLNGTISVTAEINPDRAVAESDYSNNRRNFNVRIDPPPTDLSVATVVPSKYPAGKQVITLVEVRNTGVRGFTGNETVEVKLSVPSIMFSSTKRISIAGNSSHTAAFSWTAPRNTGNFNIIAEVNPSRAITETNYSNNERTVPADTYANSNPAFGCDTVRQEWTETRVTGVSYTTVIGPDGTPHVLREVTTADFTFYARVSISARLTPGTMKSGYGAECEVTTSIETNYDNASLIIPMQEVYAYLPTSNYKEAIKLEPVPGSANRWRFPENPASVIGARVQYVPVSWPDGKPFQIGFTGRDGQSPGGALCATTYAQVMIQGNMYEDDYTAPIY